ncbi:pyridoxamine 5'-phosphate oxidase family protein [Otariodibacter oris]|uniref:Uncharacterized protein n=1 Tax=Otariodibacter oris TaxID=1032623 RepID=A0A420XJQ7_9PAST|nr:pyridoxamine 5'-phosphate oxidase family protein [Otariodibacter oris]QGM80463.1 hypothetical protein A6A10_03135 [Otariodibacter oris]RKR77391.1 hypothetical protein DES31_0721 [Otariodibacter oris]
MQKRMASYIKKMYLFTLSCTHNDIPWATAHYYVFDEERKRLIYVTSDRTHHAQTVFKNPIVAGTIFTPTRFHASLQGIQFTGRTAMLEGDEAQLGRKLYKALYDHRLIDELPVWEISLEYIRMIDHSLGFFNSIEWRIEDEDTDLESEIEEINI